MSAIHSERVAAPAPPCSFRCLAAANARRGVSFYWPQIEISSSCVRLSDLTQRLPVPAQCPHASPQVLTARRPCSTCTVPSFACTARSCRLRFEPWATPTCATSLICTRKPTLRRWRPLMFTAARPLLSSPHPKRCFGASPTAAFQVKTFARQWREYEGQMFALSNTSENVGRHMTDAELNGGCSAEILTPSLPFILHPPSPYSLSYGWGAATSNG